MASAAVVWAAPLREVIDQRVARKQQQQKLSPAPLCDDATFLRRLYLDLCGEIPTADEAREFLDDPAADKRTRLIDRLLDDPRFAQHQADVWDMIFFGRNPPGYQTNKRRGFQLWLREQFAVNRPYDQIARAILRAEGNSVEHGAPMFLVQYKNQPEDAAVKITQTFLGVQLQCARCHDHPYESWSQLDFYGTAAFLARLQVIDLGKQKDGEKYWAIGEKNLGEVNFTGPAAEDEAGKEGAPVAPKFLAGKPLDEPAPPKDLDEPRNFPSGKVPPAPAFSRKNALADWITAEDNPYFARSVANRVWAQYMGRGLVHPVDNMSESNPPSHPELLAELTRSLTDQKFDLKQYIRELVNTETYQQASTGEVTEELPRWFVRARIRPLSAEEMAAAWRTATSYPVVDAKTKPQLEKGDRFYPMGEYQSRFLGRPTDGEGNFLGGMHEHLYMSNGGIGKLFSSSQGGLLHTLAEGDAPWEQRVEHLFLAVLSRRPTAAESEKFTAHLAAAGDRPHDDAVKGAMWALMTCSEFRFNH